MAIIPQISMFEWEEIEKLGDLERLKLVIEYMPDEELMHKLEKERRNGRNDYSVRGMWNAVLAGVIYQHPTIESLLRELNRNAQMRWVCGFRDGEVPTKDAMSRFIKKLIENQEYINKIFKVLVEKLQDELPDFGKYLAINSKAILVSTCYNKKENKCN